MNRPDFQVANLFREIDPRRRGGWVLIVKGVSVICDIDRDKFGLRNMKNQNFQFPNAGNDISECWSDVSECWNRKCDPETSATSSKVPLRLPLPKIRVAHGRP